MMGTKRIAISILAAIGVGGISLVFFERHGTSQPANADPETNHRVANNSPLTLPLVNPKIVVIKHKRLLKLYSNDAVVRTYRVALGLNPVDDKVRQGDRCTPEGGFYICLKNHKSQFYLSLGLSYPNREDAERGLRDHLITRAQRDQIVRAIAMKRMPPQNTRLGGELFIHGGGSQSDWTWGCIALDNKDIRELFDAVPAGTTVTIEH
jgi:murein L,D-transpeptidase YafK